MSEQCAETIEMNRKRRRAVARLIFGQLQIMGATATLVFLIQTGVSKLTVWAAVIAALLTLTSLILFKSK